MTGEPLKILLIEDNMDHAELVIRCFEKHRIMNSIHHVNDGEKAINYLFGENEYDNREKYPLPNLILLDLRIPKVDGLEILSKIKMSDELKSIPVVVLSSSENEKDINTAYNHYVNSYLIKPLDFSKFSAMMEELGFYWLGWNKIS